MSRLLCIGYGYCARALAKKLMRDDWGVVGTSRTSDGLDAVKETGAQGFVFDGTAPSNDVSAALRETTHLLISAPPGETGDPVLTHHKADICSARDLKWVGYLSTIGVYGDQRNAWVDETTSPLPKTDRARRRIKAESAWLTLGSETGQQVQIFRLAGIYGPGRSAIDKLRAGTARRIIKPGQVFNRIHVDDVATVVLAALEGRGTYQLYNVSDDEPAPPQDVIAYAAELIGVRPPPEIPFEDARLSAMGRSFYSEQRRVANARIKEDLGVRLSYPTYREGLKAIMQA